MNKKGCTTKTDQHVLRRRTGRPAEALFERDQGPVTFKKEVPVNLEGEKAAHLTSMTATTAPTPTCPLECRLRPARRKCA